MQQFGLRIDDPCVRYWKQEHFSAMETLKALLEKHHPGVRPLFTMLSSRHHLSSHSTPHEARAEPWTVAQMTMIAAALCWIYNYSLLDGSRGDCVVLGLLQYYMLWCDVGKAKIE